MSDRARPELRDPSRWISGAAELIDAIAHCPGVVGIVRYGGGSFPDAADLDLCVVVDRRPPGLDGFHFWIGAGPVDMNVRTLDELRRASVSPEFDPVFRRGLVVYEREPGALAGLADASCPEPAPDDPAAAAARRHGHAHFLNKLDHHRDRDPVLAGALVCGAVHWLLRAYAEARGRPYLGEKAVLEAMARDDPSLLADLRIASSGAALAERIEALRRLTDGVLEPVGGPWRQGEVLVRPTSDAEPGAEGQWAEFFVSLTDPGGANAD